MHRVRPKTRIIGISTLIIAVGFGCATSEKSRQAADADRIIPPARIVTRPPLSQAADQTLVVNGVTLKNTDFDIPIRVNSAVEHWVDYFTGRGRKHFTRYLERSEYFIPYIQPILSQNKMPKDLVYLAMIESGFNNHARSRARAVGPWQFIGATGKRYGLSVNWWVDERRDIRKSTQAAANYLKDLYQMFGSWELAAASYNAGEAKIRRAVRRFGSYDFWAISRQRFLKPETRNYVPKMMAAAIISKNREQFGFPKEFGTGEILESLENGDEDLRSDEQIAAVLKDYYEEYEDEEVTPAVFADDSSDEDTSVDERSIAAILSRIPTPHVSRHGEVSGSKVVEFEIQGPADLLKVAKASGLSYQQVKALNPELLRWCTPPGTKTYRVRLPMSVKEQFLLTYNHPSFPRKTPFREYRVTSGDNLKKIARRFGLRAEPIAELNGISEKSPLRAGTLLMLPIPSDRTRSLASLDVIDEKFPSRRVRRGKAYRRSSSRHIDL